MWLPTVNCCLRIIYDENECLDQQDSVLKQDQTRSQRIVLTNDFLTFEFDSGIWLEMSFFPPQTPTFERDRIKALKNERINSQKKTFTKWVNSFLNKVSRSETNEVRTRLRLLRTLSKIHSRVCRAV